MICVIPCRAGSKSLPNKNILPLGGRPLLAWSIEMALKCGLDPYVSSDSREYLKIAEEYGATGIVRPEHLAQDSSTTFEVLADVVPRLISSNGPQDAFVLMQSTSPFRRREDILLAIRKFHQDGYDSLFTAVPIPEKWHPDQVMQEADGKILMASGVPVKERITRRQDHRPAYTPNGSMYVFKTKNLEQGNFYGDKVGIYEVKDEGVNINDGSDWAKAEEIAKIWK